MPARDLKPRPLRVLVVGHSSVPSGAELALVRRIPMMPPLGVELEFCFAADGPIVATARNAGATVHVLGVSQDLLARRRNQVSLIKDTIRFSPAVLTAARQVAAIAQHGRADVVSAYSMKAFAFGSLGARMARVPLVWEMHDIPAEPYLGAPAKRVFRVLLRALRPKVVIVPSRAVAVALQGVRTVVVPHGVPSRGTPAPLRSHRNTFRVGMAARITEWKGQHIVIEAIARLRRMSSTPIELLLAGAPWFGEERYAAGLRELVARRGLDDVVRFLGHVEDVAGFYADIDVAVHASTAPEPFGITVLEALAAGRPVVGADAGTVAEILADCDGGILVPPGDIEGLARVLSELAAEDAERTQRRGAAALERARRYDPNVEVARLADCYHTIAKR